MGPLGRLRLRCLNKASEPDFESQFQAIQSPNQDTQTRNDVLYPECPEIEQKDTNTNTQFSAIGSPGISSRSHESQPRKPRSSISRIEPVNTGDKTLLWKTIWSLLLDSTYESGRPRKFLPEGSLKLIVTENMVIQTLEIEEPDRLKDLIAFATEHCRKILATFVYENATTGAELLEHIQIFQAERCCDDNLPLNESDEIFKNIGWREKKDWRTTRFCEKQWCFLSPIITTNRKENESECHMSKLHVLPLNATRTDPQVGVINKGSFGQVYKYKIHASHFHDDVEQLVSESHLDKIQSNENQWKDEAKPEFLAVKKMIPDDPKTLAKDWWKEVYALERLKPKRHKHIVRFVTGICFEGNHDADYIMIFEWADGGNLQNLWERSPQKPVLCAKYIKEACEQIYGLADALNTAHYLDTENSYSIRHGDLKPANILCFKSTGHFPTLKIADWGLAKEHAQRTELRLYASTARYGTKRYEAPEVKKAFDTALLAVRDERKPQDPRSRLSDIWAMGCIVLEFLIWLLYGNDELVRFKSSIPDKELFFEKQHGEEKLLPVVQEWISHMELEPLCGEGTALGDLLECVQRGLLVFNLPLHKGSRPSTPSSNSSDQPPSDSDSQIDVDSFQVRVTPAEDVRVRQKEIPPAIITTGSDPTIPEIILTQARTQTMNSLGVFGKNARILADEFKNRMQDILNVDVDQQREYWYTDSERVPPSSITLNDGDAALAPHLNISGISEVNGLS